MRHLTTPEPDKSVDNFHTVKIINDAVDAIRREEQKSRPELKRTRYAWLKNETNLSTGQRETIDRLALSNLETARAYQIRRPAVTDLDKSQYCTL